MEKVTVAMAPKMAELHNCLDYKGFWAAITKSA
jgi:hypothetical protein